MEITFEDFKKLDIRIGKVEEAEQIPESRNLIKLIVDFGFEKRQCVAGILTYYDPERAGGQKIYFSHESAEKKAHGHRIPVHDFSSRRQYRKRGTGYSRKGHRCRKQNSVNDNHIVPRMNANSPVTNQAKLRFLIFLAFVLE